LATTFLPSPNASTLSTLRESNSKTVVRQLACVTQDEYQRYFAGSDQAVGIFLADAIAFEHPLSLESLRQAWPGFQPPQGFRYLTVEQRQLIGSLTVATRGRKWAA